MDAEKDGGGMIEFLDDKKSQELRITQLMDLVRKKAETPLYFEKFKRELEDGQDHIIRVK